jgi:hypothetical protein
MSTFIDCRSGLSVTRRYTCDADSSAHLARANLAEADLARAVQQRLGSFRRFGDRWPGRGG